MINVLNTSQSGCGPTYDAMKDPMDTFADFFAYRDLESHLNKLKEWKKLVTSNSYVEMDTVDNPLHDHKMICGLLHAAWLLIGRESTAGSLSAMLPKAQSLFLNRESLVNSPYVKFLSASELIEPLQGITDFFDCFTLEGAHAELYEWLNFAMGPNVSLPKNALFTLFYKGLRRLIECCWLIYIRKNVGDVPMTGPAEIPEQDFVDKMTDEISPGVMDSFRQFLSVVPAQRLNRGLRKMLVDYLFYNMNGLPTDFEEILSDFYWLTDLLDEIQGKSVDPKFL